MSDDVDAQSDHPNDPTADAPPPSDMPTTISSGVINVRAEALPEVQSVGVPLVETQQVRIGGNAGVRVQHTQGVPERVRPNPDPLHDVLRVPATDAQRALELFESGDFEGAAALMLGRK